MSLWEWNVVRLKYYHLINLMFWWIGNTVRRVSVLQSLINFTKFQIARGKNSSAVHNLFKANEICPTCITSYYTMIHRCQVTVDKRIFIEFFKKIGREADAVFNLDASISIWDDSIPSRSIKYFYWQKETCYDFILLRIVLLPTSIMRISLPPLTYLRTFWFWLILTVHVPCRISSEKDCFDIFILSF